MSYSTSILLSLCALLDKQCKKQNAIFIEEKLVIFPTGKEEMRTPSLLMIPLLVLESSNKA